MKNRLFIPIIVLMTFVLLLSGCRSNVPEEEPTPPPINEGNEHLEEEVEEDEKAVIMEEFFDLVAGNNPLIIKEYVDENIGKLSQLEGSEMINNLETSLVDNLGDVTDRLMSKDQSRELMELASEEYFFPVDKIREIENEDLRLEVETIYDSLYKLVNLEGDFYPIVDYARVQEYNNYVSDEWKEYLAVRAMDSNDLAFVDGSLVISYSDLANRIFKTENYLNKYLDSSRHEEMIDSYHNKITIYLKGIDNTPISDDTSNMIYDDVFDSFVNTSHNEGYVTANILSKYVQAIETNNKLIDDRILQLADELISEAIERLREYK